MDSREEELYCPCDYSHARLKWIFSMVNSPNMNGEKYIVESESVGISPFRDQEQQEKCDETVIETLSSSSICTANNEIGKNTDTNLKQNINFASIPRNRRIFLKLRIASDENGNQIISLIFLESSSFVTEPFFVRMKIMIHQINSCLCLPGKTSRPCFETLPKLEQCEYGRGISYCWHPSKNAISFEAIVDVLITKFDPITCMSLKLFVRNKRNILKKVFCSSFLNDDDDDHEDAVNVSLCDIKANWVIYPHYLLDNCNCVTLSKEAHNDMHRQVSTSIRTLVELRSLLENGYLCVGSRKHEIGTLCSQLGLNSIVSAIVKMSFNDDILVFNSIPIISLQFSHIIILR